MSRRAAGRARHLCVALAHGALRCASALAQPPLLPRRSRGGCLLYSQRHGHCPLPHPLRQPARPVPARPCRAPASRLLRGLPHCRRHPAAWPRLRSHAVDRPRQHRPHHLVRGLALPLGAGDRRPPDDDARLVPRCRAAERLGQLPRRRLEPEHRMAVLRPRGSAGVSQPLPSLWHARASRRGRRRHCVVLIRLARVGVQPRLPPKQGTILRPRPCGRRTRPKTGSNHGPPLRRRPARRTCPVLG